MTIINKIYITDINDNTTLQGRRLAKILKLSISLCRRNQQMVFTNNSQQDQRTVFFFFETESFGGIDKSPIFENRTRPASEFEPKVISIQMRRASLNRIIKLDLPLSSHCQDTIAQINFALQGYYRKNPAIRAFGYWRINSAGITVITQMKHLSESGHRRPAFVPSHVNRSLIPFTLAAERVFLFQIRILIGHDLTRRPLRGEKT